MGNKNKKTTKRCAICNKGLNISLERFEDEEELIESSDEGVCMSLNQVLENGETSEEYVWFCNSCHKELISRLNIDPLKILHELDEEELKDLKEKENE